MMKKFTKKYIPYKLVVNLLISIFLSIAVSFSIIGGIADEEEITLELLNELNAPYIFIALILGLYIVITAYSILFYKMAKYSLDNNQVIVQRGVIFKKKSVIDFDKIHAINSKQNLIQKLFKISTLMIDSGSANTSSQVEAIIIEDNNVIEELTNLLENKKNIVNKDRDTTFVEEKKQEVFYKFNANDKFKYSLISAFGVLVVFIIFFILTFGSMFVSSLFVDVVEEINEIYLALGISMVASMVVIFLTIIIVTFITYHDYKVYKDDDSLHIDYGLFTRTKNTFKFNRIKAIKIQQGLIARIFKIVNVRIEVIGYIEQNNSNNGSKVNLGMLFPFCHEKDIESLLESILPNFIPLKKEGKAKSYWGYIGWSSLKLIFISLCIFDFLSIVSLSIGVRELMWVSGISILTVIILGEISLLFFSWLDYLNQDIVISKDRMTLYNGGIMKVVTTIERKNVVAIEDITTSFRKKKGIYTYIVHIKSNNLTNKIRINLIDEKKKEELENFLIY